MAEEVTQEELVVDQAELELPVNDDGDYVIDLNQEATEAQKEEEETVEEEDSDAVSLGEVVETTEEPEDEVQEAEEESEPEDSAVELGQVQESEEKVVEETTDESELVQTQEDLPEDWNKMIDFLKDYPGSTPEDYVQLLKGPESLSDEELIKLSLAVENGLDSEKDKEEIDFLYEDKFSYDEELDSERDIKLKKIAIKKELNKAREEFKNQKEKYGGTLKFKDQSPEVKEALSFKKQQEEIVKQNQELSKAFQENTDKLFSKEFKGFEFKYGEDKKQVIKVGDVSKVKTNQSDIGNFINKFVGKDGNIENLNGYHKALWAANNVDALFSHAYEQGKADAVREAAKSAKNIKMDPRQDGSATEVPGQSKFRLVDDSDGDFKFTIG